jgi:hypothetical protein
VKTLPVCHVELHPIEALIGKLLYAEIRTDRGRSRLLSSLELEELELVKVHQHFRPADIEAERRHIIEALEAQFAAGLDYGESARTGRS